jgi:HEPN domain-containing protein
MKPATAEWVDKADGDFATAGRELRAAPAPNFDAACFHAQQCAEKYLKACLVEASGTFPKTHDLSALLELLLPVEPTWAMLRTDLDWLTDVGVEVRYPGTVADAADAGRAVDIAARTRAHAQRFLRLPP